MKFFKFLPVFTAAALSAAPSQQNPVGDVGDILRLGKSSYMVVFDFNSYPKYEEFQRNAQIMKNANAAIAAVNAKLEAEKDEAAKQSLALQLKQLKDEFEINDQTMQRGYNFSSNRQYLVMFLKTNICVPVSDEEFSEYKFKDGTKIDPMSIVKQGGRRFSRKFTLEGPRENDEFQRVLRFSMATRAEMAELRKKLDNNTDMDELAKISEKLAANEKALRENDEIMLKKYGLQDGQSYMIEIEKSKLLLLLTPEELSKIEAARAAGQSE